MTAILGLNAFHADSSACLLIDGKLVGAVAEERLGTRQKHTSAFPENAIRWLLKDNGLRISDIRYVAIARDTRANRGAKARFMASNPAHGIQLALQHNLRQKTSESLVGRLAEICGEDKSAANFETIAVEHHLAHIASSYYCSPFEDVSAGFSYDASGDFASAMVAKCEGNKIDILDRVHLPDSLGFFYTALCQFIGFDRFGEEYKVMGLAPYGSDVYADEMKTLVNLPEDGLFSLNRSMFKMPQSHHTSVSGEAGASGVIDVPTLYKPKLKTLFGEPARRDEVTQREMDISRSTQKMFEDAALHALRNIHKKIPSSRLVMAGGCALNGVANARILRETPFETPYLQAAASDDGTCLGAALWVWHNVVGSKERFHMQHAFWGPEYCAAHQKKAVEATGLEVVECKDDDHLVETVSELIADGLVTGWYQGRSEWGPRALGHRSILANPAIPTMKETINAKIKRRESFRPFAPSVLQEDVSTFFEMNVSSPFMMHVVKIRPEWRDRLPAVTHVDGTGRLQTVDPQSNELYHKLITAFKKRTGIGMVLNTSFNENEPVVDTPEQAVDCFLRTDMDALCVGRFVVKKAVAG